MLPVHWRLAELWTLQQSRALSREEQNELSICLHYNANYARKLSDLYNLSLAASMTQDIDWQHDVCRKIEEIEGEYRVQWPDFKKSEDCS